MPEPIGIGRTIERMALELLDQNPEGLTFSLLLNQIMATDQTLNEGTVGSTISYLAGTYPDKVYKPSRGLYRLVKYRPMDSDDSAPDVAAPATIAPASTDSVKESDFYGPFANWLKNEIEDATKAVPLGGNKFGGKWGTPDVIGKWESGPRDIIKGLTEIISAEIKTEPSQLVTAFGQACAYKLFSHRVYLVVPQKSGKEEISRLDSLCQIFGIGLVTFDADHPGTPDFRILVRPTRHEPDLFYTNKYMPLIEKELFG